CVNDERKRLICFSAKGKKLIAKLEPIWRELQIGIDDILNETHTPFMNVLGALEASLRSTPLSERVISALHGASDNGEVEIVGWNPRYAAAFEDLNREWIEKHFRLEKNDAAILGDPEAHILAPGGAIFFAKLGGAVVGTCAVFKRDDRTFELG